MTETLGQALSCRIEATPFYIYSVIIFILAITHTLLAHQIASIAHRLEEAHKKNSDISHFGIEILHFLGEVEIIFAIWVIPLMIGIAIWWDWGVAIQYVNSINYTEPVFVVVIMSIASTKPIVDLADRAVRKISSLLGGKTVAWWLVILTVGPILGSLITEPGAMTLSSLLLAKEFYVLKPSVKLSYATLGLLFVNVSMGGVLTNFAAPPVLMVANTWGWSSLYMLINFGIRAIIGILISNALYYFIFRKELRSLKREEGLEEIKEDSQSIPPWVSLANLIFLILIVLSSHYLVLCVGVFFLFIAFHRATKAYQQPISLRGPLLVGAFLAGLVIHGSLQGWWIEPVIKSLGEIPAMVVAAGLSAFNDNAMITYLSSLIPDLATSMKVAIVSGAVAGGGLTVIANAPNPAGQVILNRYFKDGIAPIGLLLAAIIPTVIVLILSIIYLRIFIT